MKKITLTTLSLLLTLLVTAQNNIGIGTNTPDSSAKLDIQATDKGVLIPRVDIGTTVFPGSGPAKGLMVWNTNNSFKSGEGFYYNEGTKTAPIWVRFGKYSNSNLTDVGVVIAFPGASYPNDMYLPLNGGVYNKIDYPDFVEMIASLDANVVTADATTFTLADWNSNGEFLRGQGTNSAAVGSLQTDATARPNTNFTTTSATTSTNGSHTHSQYRGNGTVVYASTGPNSTHEGNGQWTNDRDGSFSGPIASAGNHSHSIPALSVTGGGDTETRPVNRSVTWLIKVKPSSAIVDTLIVNSVSNTSNITDVNTAPHAQQTSIAKGATLRCFDGVNWEADVVEGFSNANQDFSTPWGLNLTVGNNLNQQQSFIRNSSGSTKYGAYTTKYRRINDNVTDSGERVFKNFANTAYREFWGDNTLVLDDQGDIETMHLIWANSLSDMSAGNYQEFMITAVIGWGYNNNYFRVQRIK